MGASDSKLAFRKGVFRLNEESNIPAHDQEYWNAFLTLPESQEDVFQLFSPADIRKIISSSPENIKTLLLKICSHLLEFAALEELPTRIQVKSTLNCFRILTRIMPYILENKTFETEIFWTVVVEEAKRSNHPEKRYAEKTPEAFLSPVPAEEVLAPLAERLLGAVVNILFLPGFSLPADALSQDKRIRYLIWESGVGASTAPVCSNEMIQHRMETLKCLLVLFSHSIYTPSNELVSSINPWIHYVVTRLDKQPILGLLCSLLNSILKYSPAGWMPYDHVLFSDYKESFVLLSSEVLAVLLNYTQGLDSGMQSINGNSSQGSQEDIAQSSNNSRRPSVEAILPPRLEEYEQSSVNRFRFYLSKIHRKSDFQLIFDGLCSLLVNPLQANNTYLPYSVKQVTFTEEILMLFWKIMQINARFFTYVSSHEKILDITAALVFQAVSSKGNMSKVGLLRTSSFILHVLSGERQYAVLLNRPFLTTLPSNVDLPVFKGCYGDLLILAIFSLTFTTKGKLMSMYDCFLTIIANISPYLKSLCAVTANKLMVMFTTFVNPAFLVSNEGNHILCFFLLDTFNNILQYQFDGNHRVVYEILRHKDKFLDLKNLTLESAVEAYDKLLKKRQLTMEISKTEVKAPESSVLADKSADEIRSEPISPFSNMSQPSLQRSMTVPNSPLPSNFNETSNPVEITHQGNDSGRFKPTKEWFESWHKNLPLHTCLSLLDNLGPHIEQLCEENNWNDEAVLGYLQSGTLVGLLPVPHPIFVRKFHYTDGIYVWFSSYMWGVIYLRHTAPLPVIWIGSKVKLFVVKTVESTE